jgi:hypothetical protein
LCGGARLARVNNAGTNAYKYGLLAEACDADLVDIVQTNVLGVMLGCKEARAPLETKMKRKIVPRKRTQSLYSPSPVCDFARYQMNSVKYSIKFCPELLPQPPAPGAPGGPGLSSAAPSCAPACLATVQAAVRLWLSGHGSWAPPRLPRVALMLMAELSVTS